MQPSEEGAEGQGTPQVPEQGEREPERGGFSPGRRRDPDTGAHRSGPTGRYDGPWTSKKELGPLDFLDDAPPDATRGGPAGPGRVPGEASPSDAP